MLCWREYSGRRNVKNTRTDTPADTVAYSLQWIDYRESVTPTFWLMLTASSWPAGKLRVLTWRFSGCTAVISRY